MPRAGPGLPCLMVTEGNRERPAAAPPAMPVCVGILPPPIWRAEGSGLCATRAGVWQAAAFQWAPRRRYPAPLLSGNYHAGGNRGLHIDTSCPTLRSGPAGEPTRLTALIS